jgi:hypothetical protein
MKRILFIALIVFMASGCVAENPENEDLGTDRIIRYGDNFANGYDWAEANEIDSFDDCQKEFGTGEAEDGCNEYVKETETGFETFDGYECTEDCSGHEAGYNWAEENGVDDIDDCGGSSNSFIEGCESYVNDNY